MEHSLGRTGPCLFLQFVPAAQPVPITHLLWRSGVPTRIQTHIHEHPPVFTLCVCGDIYVNAETGCFYSLVFTSNTSFKHMEAELWDHLKDGDSRSSFFSPHSLVMNLLLDPHHLLDYCWLLLLKICFSLCYDKKQHAWQYLTVLNDFYTIIYYFLEGNFVVFELIITGFCFSDYDYYYTKWRFRPEYVYLIKQHKNMTVGINFLTPFQFKFDTYTSKHTTNTGACFCPVTAYKTCLCRLMSRLRYCCSCQKFSKEKFPHSKLLTWFE